MVSPLLALADDPAIIPSQLKVRHAIPLSRQDRPKDFVWLRAVTFPGLPL